MMISLSCFFIIIIDRRLLHYRPCFYLRTRSLRTGIEIYIMSKMSKEISIANSGLPNGNSTNAASWFVGMEKKSSLSSVDWNKTEKMAQKNGTIPAFRAGNGSSDLMSSFLERPSELNGFSSSLPALLDEKLNLASSIEQSDDIRVDQDVGEEPLDQEIVSRAIGDILPHEDELLAGLTDGFTTSMTEESEDVDIFSSSGGLEMDGETQEGFGMYMNRLDGFIAGVNFHGPVTSGPGSVIGEHPYGEHPSRTLFVRNINSNVEDSELRSLFEQYGDIRTLYTACKHRGFVMISYYDIRSARSAMRALQSKPLRRRKLDIHFSIPKDNPSDKDINQGTLVVFNLDASVSNDDLRQIFGQYGEVKEIRETPHKRHHKFIEFYDVRAAEAALRALNRSDIAGKRIKLEPSRPGGARRSLMQQLSQEPEQEDIRFGRQQSSPPFTNSPPGHFSCWGHFGSPAENGPHRSLHPLGTSVPNMNKNLPNLPIPRVGTIGSHRGRSSQIDVVASLQSSLGVKGVLPHHAHSLPEYSNGILPFVNSSSSSSMGGAAPNGPENESSRLPRTSSDLSLFEHAPGGPGMSSGQGMNSGSVGSASLSGPQFLWGNSSSFQQNSSPMVWSNASSMGPNFNLVGHTPSQSFGYARNQPHYANAGLHSQRHHVGSAPSGDPSFLERQFAYVHESPDSSFFGPGSLSSMNVPGTNGAGMMSLGSHNTLGANGFFDSNTSLNLGVMSPHRRNPMFPPGGIVLGSNFDIIGIDRGRIRRIDNSASQADNKKQYQLDIDRISRGEDSRTTLMIKNIPNKYTSKMLLAAIDENHKGMYDFLYLPIDFKNKCNVGYAFINMTSPEHIIPIYQSFNGKKWEKFNSEKVASLAYARIQGKAALVAHFQNSSLMNEDKRCRPILLNSEGNEHEQEPMYLEIGTRSLVALDSPKSKTDSQDGGSGSEKK